MLKKIQNFLRNEEGATAIEYGLIAGLIAVVIVLAVTNAGISLQGIFASVSGAIAPAAR